MGTFQWTETQFRELDALYLTHKSWRKVAGIFSAKHGGDSSAEALRSSWRRWRKAQYKHETYETLSEPHTPSAPAIERPATGRSYVALLLSLAKRSGGVSVDAAADALDVSPKRIRDAVGEAVAAGYALVEQAGVISIRLPQEATKPIAFGEYASEGIALVTSDMHIADIHHCREEMLDHIHTGHKAGATVNFIPGDVVAGNFDRHGRWELTHHGIDQQYALAFNPKTGLPVLPGLIHVIITGNHDETHGEKSGADVAAAMRSHAHAQGRTDIRIVGQRGAMVQYRGTSFYLWHPMKQGAYSRSYHLQNWYRERGDAPKPDVLLAGHWHQCCLVQVGKSYAFSCGTFQHGDSMFGKSIGGGVALGGWLLRWNRDAHRITRLVPEWRSYWRQSTVEIIEDGGDA